ncbi:transposase family protein [Nostoc sp. UCD121]|nr:transposase family protein [Nostoc sp. UCD120]MBC1277284.1 transposase family protein [Nostoc sp. UCD121]MBC1294015.1 transposase family protein [Nostoc sp. UCD122]
MSLTAWLRLPHSQPKWKTGRPGKLSLQDQLLMTLQYWREYCTYFHIRSISRE